jgi:hypothetical protein
MEAKKPTNKELARRIERATLHLDKTKNTKEEIEAALDYALGGKKAAPKAPVEEAGEVEQGNEPVCKDEEPCKNDDGVSETKEDENNNGFDPVVDETASPVAMSVEDFGRKCFNLDMNASMAHYQSTKHKDKTIEDYLRGINKKIYDETQRGGYSTNVQFRVTPQDWVNVNHIFDWYRTRGFVVEVKETTSAPYGKEVGTMNYNFTISWSSPQ